MVGFQLGGMETFHPNIYHNSVDAEPDLARYPVFGLMHFLSLYLIWNNLRALLPGLFLASQAAHHSLNFIVYFMRVSLPLSAGLNLNKICYFCLPI